MAASLADFAEQANPNTLAEVRRAGFKQATRVHGSLLATAEKRVLIWMAERMPKWIGSDHLTILGFGAQIATGVCYALAARDRRMLLLAIVCLAVNWFGDSLDGTLARVRQQQRPRYGFYVDHIIDSIGAVAMMGGLALSGYMHPVIAIGLLIGFLLLSIQSYLATYTLGEFHLSIWHFGPTELRILLAIGNLALFRWAWVLDGRYRLVRHRRHHRTGWDGRDADRGHIEEHPPALPRREDSMKNMWGRVSDLSRPGPARQALLWRWLKFNFVGGIGIAVQLFALAIFRSLLLLDYLPATVLAVETAVIHNFLWHEHFTWADRSSAGVASSLARFTRFNASNGVVSILGNLSMMRLLVGQLEMNYFAANLIAIATCSLVNFALSDCLVFPRQRET